MEPRCYCCTTVHSTYSDSPSDEHGEVENLGANVMRTMALKSQTPPPYRVFTESFGLLEEYAETCGIESASGGPQKVKMAFIASFVGRLSKQADMRTF